MNRASRPSLSARRGFRNWIPATVATVALLASPGLITAQSSPSPSWYMYDSRPYNGYPPKFPGESGAPKPSW